MINNFQALAGKLQTSSLISLNSFHAYVFILSLSEYLLTSTLGQALCLVL